MVRLLAFFLLLVAAPACAQWTQPQTFVSFDRGHGGSGHKHSHILAAPQNPIPDWPFRNINVTHVPLVDQTEPSIAINPLDSNNIIIGANDDRYLYPNDSALWAYSSTDGGWTWINQPLPGELPEWVVHATDPSVTFSSDGKAYFGNGHYRYNNYRTDVALYQSPNKGNTWEVVGYPFFNDDPNDDTTTDKYFFAIDPVPSSPFHNRMYATWVEYTEPPNVQIMASYSTDGGTTWSHRTPLTTPGYYHAPVPATAPDGTVIVTYVNYKIGQDSILSIRSVDGGRTWSKTIPVAPYIDIAPIQPQNNNNGYPIIKGIVMVNSFPSISIDHSSSHPGRAYVTWCGQDAKGRVRVFLSTSDDDGTHWSSPRDVDGDTSSNPTDKFFSWVGVDPQNGNVAIDFNDSRSDPDNILSDIFMAFSTDGGDSFSVRRISDASSDSRAGDPFDQREVDGTYFQFFGDYIGIAGQSDRWYPAWTDCRSGDDLDIYTAIVEPFAPMPVSNLVALDTVIGGKQETLLTWEYKSETTFGYPLPAGYQFDLTNDGTHIHMLPSGNTSYLDTNAAASNEYGVTVLSGKYRSTTDSVRSGTSFVILRADKSSPAIRLSKSPAIAGRQEILSFQSTRQGTVVLSLYNELGQMMGAPMDDRGTGFAHEFRFTPVTPGVRFYLLQETTESGASEMAGKFVVTPE